MAPPAEIDHLFHGRNTKFPPLTEFWVDVKSEIKKKNRISKFEHQTNHRFRNTSMWMINGNRQRVFFSIIWTKPVVAILKYLSQKVAKFAILSICLAMRSIATKKTKFKFILENWFHFVITARPGFQLTVLPISMIDCSIMTPFFIARTHFCTTNLVFFLENFWRKHWGKSGRETIVFVCCKDEPEISPVLLYGLSI